MNSFFGLKLLYHFTFLVLANGPWQVENAFASVASVAPFARVREGRPRGNG
jgi:hypothetical protein